MINTKNTLSKAVAGGALLVLALSASSVAHAQMASTMSTAQIQAEIASLQAQLTSQQGGGTSMMVAPMFSTNLTIGSSGTQVLSLQNWLIAKGFTIPAGPTGHFGAQTQSALAAYQSANGIFPAVGFFGPTTRAHVNAAGGVTMNMSPGTSMVAGCSVGAMYNTMTGQPCSSTSSFSNTSSLDSQMSAILGQESGLSSDLSQTGSVSGQSDTGY